MHQDVMALVEGGYSAHEIIEAFVGTYGERVLMAPKREGFNWAGYIVPFAALGAGTVAVVAVLRGMQRRTALVAATTRRPSAAGPLASDEELTKLRAALRRDD
jgi:cytochrome c-type biogenesis protein CcmH